MSNLTWFLHKPTDEREQALYQRAYQTAFYTASICLILGLVFAWVLPDPQITVSQLGWAAFLTLVLSYITGWVMLRKEDLSFEPSTTTPDLRKKLRNYWLSLVVYTVIPLGMVVIHPELYLRMMFTWALLVYCASLGGAIAFGRVFPLPSRIALAIFLPFPTMIWLSFSKTPTAKKLGLVIVLCVAMIVSVGIMIIAIRQFVVSPYYIGTDAFAPTYTKGQYVMVNQRQLHPIVGQYIMYYQKDNRPMVGEVLAVSQNHYQIKTSEGEKTVSQGDLFGTILPTDSWFNWLRAN